MIDEKEQNEEIEIEENSSEEEMLSRIHEIDLILENYEQVTYADDLSEEQYQEMVRLKEEYKELNKKIKALKKTNKSVWDLIPLWMMIFSGIALLLVIFPVTPFLPDYFAEAIVNIMPEAWHTEIAFWITYALYYVIIAGLSWLIFSYIKKDSGYRKIYLIYLFIQLAVIVITNLVFILITVL